MSILDLFRQKVAIGQTWEVRYEGPPGDDWTAILLVVSGPRPHPNGKEQLWRCLKLHSTHTSPPEVTEWNGTWFNDHSAKRLT